MATKQDPNRITEEAPYGYLDDGVTPRKRRKPGSFVGSKAKGETPRPGPVEIRKVDHSTIKRAKPNSTPSGLLADLETREVVFSSDVHTEEYGEWEPDTFEIAGLIAQGYDPENSVHFRYTTEDDIDAARRLIRKGVV